jgi:hypothetical protein
MPLPSPLSTVPDPPLEEQVRQLAATIKDLYEVMEIIVRNAEQFIPGEAVNELKDAWEETQAAEIDKIIPQILQAQAQPGPLIANGLLGKSGKLKTSWAGKLKDKFYELFHSQNKTATASKNTAEAAAGYLHTIATILRSIPGAHAAEEFVALTGGLVSHWAKR